MPHDQHQPPVTTVQLNHTNVYATDQRTSAEFIAEVLGLRVSAPAGPFLPVDLGNGVTLDYYEGATNRSSHSTTRSSCPTISSTP
jgi:hypothetical protein